MNRADAQRSKAWPTRYRRYGETGHCKIRTSRFWKREKPLRTRGKVGTVYRETVAA